MGTERWCGFFSAYVAVVVRVRTPLQIAHSEGHTEVVRQLESAGMSDIDYLPLISSAIGQRDKKV